MKLSKNKEKVNGLYGWYFNQETIEIANSKAELMTLDFELGATCPLCCIYCYRTDDSRDLSIEDEKHLLSFKHWKEIVDDAEKLGVKSVKMIGGGEITEEKNFLEAMEYIAQKDIIIVLFTAGTTLGDDNLCQRVLGMNSRDLAQWMFDLGMSVFIKMDSLDETLQDKIAGRKGFTDVRDKAFELLLEFDFNKHNPTRLGLEVNVSRFNYHEIMDIYALRIKHNLYEDVVISMPCDAYYRNKDYDITMEQKKELYLNIYKFNQDNGIPFDRISPFMGGLECTQLGNGLYVTNRGDVYHCPGAFDLIGNVKEKSLIDIWKGFDKSKKYHEHFFCPFREETGILPTELVKEIEKELDITT